MKDMIYTFFENKLSPIAQVVKNLLEGETFKGEEPTVANTVRDLTVPISIETFFETWKDPASAPLLLSTIAEAVGVGTQTYSGKKRSVGIK